MGSMKLAQQFTPNIFDTDSKKLTKEEIEKIFAKYTKHFKDFFHGTYRSEEEDEEEKKGERDRKDYN